MITWLFFSGVLCFASSFVVEYVFRDTIMFGSSDSLDKLFLLLDFSRFAGFILLVMSAAMYFKE